MNAMGIRDTINNKPQISLAVVAVLFVVGLCFVWLTRSAPATVIAKQMFYSADDGKTWFADDTTKIYPFDHDGQPAYRVYVYRGKGEPFVGYLARYTDETRNALLALKGKTDPESRSKFAQLVSSGIEVKRPSDTKWLPASSGAGEKIMMVTPPDGGELHGITP